MTDSPGYWQTVLAVARKDLAIELRAKRVSSSAAAFALLVVVVFAFGFTRAVADVAVVASGALWVAFVFTGTFAMSQSLSSYPHTRNVPEPMLIEFDRSENPLRSDLLESPFDPSGGTIDVPQEPGLGIEIDRDALERYRAD